MLPQANEPSALQTLRCANQLTELARQAHDPAGQSWYSSGSVIWLSRLPYAELPPAVANHFGPGYTPFLVAAAGDTIILKAIPPDTAAPGIDPNIDLNEEDIATLLAEAESQ